jgi:hypothetical protein
VAQGDRLDFVGRYVARAVELRDRLGAEDVVLVVPVPPSDVGLEHPDLPRTGTLAERVAATRLLELRLCEEVERLGDPTVTALPIGPALEEPGTGALDARFTEDGVHVNPLGAERVRAGL